MFKKLSEMAAHKKGIRIKVVVPKKHFFFVFTVFNRTEQFFQEYSVSLLHKSKCCHPLFNGYCIYFKRALAAMNELSTMYMSDISI